MSIKADLLSDGVFRSWRCHVSL